MVSRGFLRRWRGLGAANRRLLFEALPALILASAAIRLVPFRRLAARASRRPRRRGAADEAFLRKLRWAVDAWGERLPWRALCFERGLAVHRMLNRRGIPSVLHYGVARDGESGIAAHVWVTVAGRAVIGGEEAPRFACVARFPEPE
jgi:hypothetical protein